MSLVTLANYKTALNIDGSTEDTKLTQYSAEIDDKIKTYLGRDIEEATYTDEIYDGSGTNYLVTRQRPITAISTLKVYEGLDGDGAEDWETWEQNDEYQRLIILKEAHTLYMDPKFPEGKQNLKITYTAGYAAADIPDDIDYVAKQLMAIKYMVFDKKLLGKTSISISVGSSHSATYELDEQKILKQIEHYRDLRF